MNEAQLQEIKKECEAIEKQGNHGRLLIKIVDGVYLLETTFQRRLDKGEKKVLSIS